MEALIQELSAQLPLHRGIASLALQNHIYGCFLLMEDLAQKAATLTGTHIQPFDWDVVEDFSEIGMRYGFIMDRQLADEVDSFSDSYQAAWVAWFQQVAEEKQVEKVDETEDRIISLLRQTVPAEEAFFSHALETGELSIEWKNKAVKMLLAEEEEKAESEEKAEAEAEEKAEGESSAQNVVPQADTQDEEPPTKLSQAHIEKQVHIEKQEKPRRMFATTRRRHRDLKKSALSTTRRSHTASIV
jgi:hypothetical protein